MSTTDLANAVPNWKLSDLESPVMKVAGAPEAAAHAVVNGTKKSVHAVANVAKEASTVQGQDKLFYETQTKVDSAFSAAGSAIATAARKAKSAHDTGLDAAENWLKEEAANTVIEKAVDVSGAVKALEKAKFEHNEEDSAVKTAAKKAINGLLTYHQKTIEGGEKAGRIAAKATYIATKWLTCPLSLFRAGRVVQEGIATGLAFVARAVTTVVAALVVALPELAVVGGLTAAATFAGLGIAAGGVTTAATVGALKVSGIVAGIVAGAAYILRNEILHAQAKDHRERLEEKQDTSLEVQKKILELVRKQNEAKLDETLTESEADPADNNHDAEAPVTAHTAPTADEADEADAADEARAAAPVAAKEQQGWIDWAKSFFVNL